MASEIIPFEEEKGIDIYILTISNNEGFTAADTLIGFLNNELYT